MSAPLSEKKITSSQDTNAIFYFLLLGGTSGCSWTAAMNCLDYFSTKFSQYNIGFIFPLAPYLAQVLCVLSITKISSIWSYNTRIIFSLITIMCVASFLPLEAALFKDTDFGMYLIMILFFILGFYNTLIYASLAGLTSQIQGKYTAYFLIGTAVNGLGMNFLRELTLVIFNPDSEEDLINVIAYFTITNFLILFTLAAHASFMKSDFYRSHFGDLNSSQVTDSDTESSLLHPAKQDSEKARSFRVLIAALKDAKYYIFLLALSYTQLMVAYPGLMLKKPIANMTSHTKTVSMLTVYNIFFILGKKMGQYRQYYNQQIVLGTVILRFILVAFFVAQVITAEIAVFNTVWFGFLNIAMFGLTLGFVNVALFIMGPEKVKPEKKEIVGFLSVFGVNVGLILGATVAFSLRNIGSHVE